MRHDGKTEGDQQKPKIAIHCNKTKSGVDNMDHSAIIFSYKRKSN